MDLIEFTHTAGVYHPTQVDHGSVGVSGHKKQEEGNYLSSSLEVFCSSRLSPISLPPVLSCS
jgi:hypothetical protein